LGNFKAQLHFHIATLLETGLALHLGRENLQDSFPLPSDKETAQDIPLDPRPESWGQGSKSRMGGTGRAHLEHLPFEPLPLPAHPLLVLVDVLGLGAHHLPPLTMA